MVSLIVLIGYSLHAFISVPEMKKWPWLEKLRLHHPWLRRAALTAMVLVLVMPGLDHIQEAALSSTFVPLY
jgi:hypothetical protein